MRYFFLIMAIVATSVSGFLVREADLNPVMLSTPLWWNADNCPF